MMMMILMILMMMMILELRAGCQLASGTQMEPAYSAALFWFVSPSLFSRATQADQQPGSRRACERENEEKSQGIGYLLRETIALFTL